jgi:ABC-type polar amino acid transport system ATPase subunit
MSWRGYDQDEEVPSCRQTYNFFNVWKDMHNLVHYCIDHQGMAEEGAIKESNKISELVPVPKKTRRWPQKAVFKAFQI